ncbi:hypothetical protein V1514DRAFT_327135 [Lipomyces japonicus]|uniref:uncharacterized protein n=1 Tax=Lipomyces japonicus TaxID=56871 RepID=UPI0034CDE304
MNLQASMILNYRKVLEEFTSAEFNIRNQEHEFEEWSSSQSIVLGSSRKRPRHDENNDPTMTQSLQKDLLMFNRLNMAEIQYELKDYKELFSKLKLTYLEQETKETFLRVILDEEEEQRDDENYKENHKSHEKKLPLWKLGQNDIEQVNNTNGQLKQVLVSKKQSLQDTSDQIAKLVNQTCEKYEKLKSEVIQAKILLNEMQDMLAEFESLQQQQDQEQSSDNNIGHGNLSLTETKQLQKDLKLKDSQLGFDIDQLQVVTLPQQVAELSRLQSELTRLQSIKFKLENMASQTLTTRQAEIADGKFLQKQNMAKWHASAVEIVKSILMVDNVSVDKSVGTIDVIARTARNRKIEVRLEFESGFFKNAKMSVPVMDVSSIVDNAKKLQSIRYYFESIKLLVDE